MKLTALFASAIVVAVVVLVDVSAYGSGFTSGRVSGYQYGLQANSNSACARVEVWARANLDNEKARVASQRDTVAYAKLISDSIVASKNYICGTGANPALNPLSVTLGAPTLPKADKQSSPSPELLSGQPKPKPKSSPSPSSSPSPVP